MKLILTSDLHQWIPKWKDLVALARQEAPRFVMARSIWLIHQPPSDLGMDICGSGQRVGSSTVLQFIRTHQPLLGCSGHIHESPYQPGGQWVAPVGRSLWVQPGQIDRALHYVAVELSPQLEVQSARHSLFGERVRSTNPAPDRGRPARSQDMDSRVPSPPSDLA